MIRDDIIRMARDAGFVVDEKARQHQPNCIFHTHHMVDKLLERFAALVISHHVKENRPKPNATERAGCGKLSDMWGTEIDGYAVRCIDGTQYVLMSSPHGLAITPHVGTDGKPKGCP